MDGDRSETATFLTGSEAETLTLGEALGRRIESGACFSLQGSLGSGKTVLVRGICKGLGIGEDVISPTFILCEEYDGRLPVVHTDFFRLELESDVDDLGVLDRTGDAVILAEWGDRSRRLLDLADAVVNITIVGDTERRIEVVFRPSLANLFEELQ